MQQTVDLSYRQWRSRALADAVSCVLCNKAPKDPQLAARVRGAEDVNSVTGQPQTLYAIDEARARMTPLVMCGRCFGEIFPEFHVSALGANLEEAAA